MRHATKFHECHDCLWNYLKLSAIVISVLCAPRRSFILADKKTSVVFQNSFCILTFNPTGTRRHFNAVMSFQRPYNVHTTYFYISTSCVGWECACTRHEDRFIRWISGSETTYTLNWKGTRSDARWKKITFILNLSTEFHLED